MIFLLILQITFGFVLIGEFPSEETCEEAGVQHLALLAAQKSDDRHNAKAMCVVVPQEMPTPPSMKQAHR